MQKPWDIIAELESDNSRLFKEEVIARESLAGNDELFRGFRAAYDAMVTFGVKKVEEKKGDGKGITSDSFWKTADQLQKRELTGNAALTAINFLRMNAKEDEWNYWYRRILIKDMRCGTSDSTINKHADPRYHVPVFECQLAHDGAKHESKIKGQKLIEVKLDGMRVLTIVYPSGQVDQYSRNGKELVNFPEVKRQIAKHAIFFAEPMVLDGEIMSANFQDLMKQAHRKSDVQTDDAVLHLFDIIPLAAFQEGQYDVGQTQRTAALTSWYLPIADHMPNVTVLGNELVDLDSPDGYERFKEINRLAIEINPDTGLPRYEGIMLKEPDAPYECKRTVSWLKIKPFIEVTLKIKSIERGDPNKKYRDTMGAALCEGEDDEKFIRVSVGGGWSDKLRDEMYADPDSYLEQLVEIRGDALTISQDSDGVWSIRFPRFKTFRGFAAGEKL